MYEKISQLCYFNDNPLSVAIPSVVSIGSLLVALKRAGLLVMRRGCRLKDGLIELLQMFGVTTIGIAT